MAKSKKKPVRKTSRRRVSGIAGSGIVSKVGGALVGAIAGRMLSQKLMPNLDEKIKGAAIAAAGVFLVPKFIKGPMGEGLAIGMAVAGGTAILQGTGLIAGLTNSPVMYLPASRTVAGNGVSQAVAGGGVAQQVAGYTLTKRQKAEA